MRIPLNNILNLTDEQVANSKIELNMAAGKRGGAIYRSLARPSRGRKDIGIGKGVFILDLVQSGPKEL